MPAVIAIHPASRPITSHTSTRLCASAVECSRSTASVAIVTAVSKPKQASVPLKSLSIVFGTPTHFTPFALSAKLIDCVSSPPNAMSASILFLPKTSRHFSNPPGIFFTFVREDRRIVPPFCRIPEVVSSVSGIVTSSRTPRHPSINPTNSSPWCRIPLRTAARITAFNPGQSPPPVNIPTRIILSFELLNFRKNHTPDQVILSAANFRPHQNVCHSERSEIQATSKNNCHSERSEIQATSKTIVILSAAKNPRICFCRCLFFFQDAN